MGELAAVGSLLGGAAQVGSLFMSNNDAANQQAAIANANLRQQQDAQRNQMMYNAEALRRSIAGMVDGSGNEIYYDPATNTWRTRLSAVGKELLNSQNNASIHRATTDLQRQDRANSRAENMALGAEGTANSMLESIKRYIPRNADEVRGCLQEASTLAAKNTYEPIRDSMLRQFARTGSAAGPVMAEMGRKQYESLRQTMIENELKAMSSTADINQRDLGSQIANYSAMRNAATPNYGYSPLPTDNPVSSLLAAINSRAGGAASAATGAAYSLPGMQSGQNAAALMALRAVPNSNLLSAQLQGISKMLSPANLQQYGSAYNTLFGTNSATNNAGTMGDMQNYKYADTAPSLNYDYGYF